MGTFKQQFKAIAPTIDITPYQEEEERRRKQLLEAAQTTPTAPVSAPQADFSAGKLAKGVVDQGLHQFVQGELNTAAFLSNLPGVKQASTIPVVGKYLNPVTGPMILGMGGAGLGLVSQMDTLSDPDKLNALRESSQKSLTAKQEDYARNAALGGTAGQLANKYGAATVAAVPQALLAILTAGESAAAGAATAGAEAAAGATGKGILSKLAQTVTSTATNPQFYASLSQVIGTSYFDAADYLKQKNNGKLTESDKAIAATYAVVNGTINSVIEQGFGIEAFPKKLQEILSKSPGNKSLLLQWVKESMGEGGEEVLQGVVERGLQNAMLGNKDAKIADVPTALEEFTGGAVVGGILGGGQLALMKSINAAANQSANLADADSPLVKAFLDTGMKLKTAQKKAAVIRDLLADGESVLQWRYNSIDPMSKQTQEIFSQLTGADFSGAQTKEEVRDIYNRGKEFLKAREEQAKAGEKLQQDMAAEPEPDIDPGDTARAEDLMRDIQATPEPVQEDAFPPQEETLPVTPNPDTPLTENAQIGPETRNSGLSGVTYADGETPVAFHWAILPVEDLIISNDEWGVADPSYPKELQPRDRTRQGSQEQIQRMSNRLNPALLEVSPTAQNGAPITREDGVVIGGNARSAAIRAAYQNGRADVYEAYIRENAARFGLDPANIPEHPVLVRVVDGAEDTAKLARDLNAPTTAAYSTTEAAQSDVERMGEILPLLVPNDDGNVNTAANRDFISQFISNVPQSERAALTDANGELSQAGLDRVTNAVFAYAYGDTRLLAKLSESLRNDTKTITNALVNAAPAVAALRVDMEKGNAYNVDVVRVLMDGLDLFAEARGAKLTVEEAANQASLDTSYDSSAIAVAEVVEEFRRSARGIQNFTRDLVDSVRDFGDPGQISLLGGDEDATAEGAVDRALERTNRRETERYEATGRGKPKNFRRRDEGQFRISALAETADQGSGGPGEQGERRVGDTGNGVAENVETRGERGSVTPRSTVSKTTSGDTQNNIAPNLRSAPMSTDGNPTLTEELPKGTGAAEAGFRGGRRTRVDQMFEQYGDQVPIPLERAIRERESKLARENRKAVQHGKDRVAEVRAQKNAQIEDVRLAERMNAGRKLAEAKRKGEEAAAKERQHRIERVKEIRQQKNAQIAATHQHEIDRFEKLKKSRELKAGYSRFVSWVKRLAKLKTTSENTAAARGALSEGLEIASTYTARPIKSVRDLEAVYHQWSTDGLIDRFPEVDEMFDELRRRSEIEPDTVVLNDLSKILGYIYHEIRNGDKILSAKRNEPIRAAATDTLERLPSTPKLGRHNVEALNKFDDFTVSASIPRNILLRMANHNENHPLLRLFDDLNDGYHKQVDFRHRGEDIFSDFTDRNGMFHKWYEKNTGKNPDAIEIRGETEDGYKTVKIDMLSAVSLAAAYLDGGHTRHLERGGIIIPDFETYHKSSRKETGQTTHIQFGEATLKDVYERLDSAGKYFVKAIQDYNAMAAKEVNNAFEETFGYQKFDSDSAYWRILTNSDFRFSEVGSISAAPTTAGAGQYIERQAGASNAVNLVPADIVLRKGMATDARAAGVMRPLRNWKKFFGYTERYSDVEIDENGKEKEIVKSGRNVKNELRNHFGDKPIQVIDTLLQQMDAGRAYTPGALDKLTSNLAASTLTGNVRVGAIQFGSYFTSSDVLGWEPVLKTLFSVDLINNIRNAAQIEAKMDPWTPLHRLRREGYSTKELGDLAQSDSPMAKFLRNHPGFNLIQGMDILTTRLLWPASERYVAKNFPDLEAGSDAFMQKTAEIYNKTIEQTQPNYEPQWRTDLQRSGDSLTRNIFGMYKTVPFQLGNMIGNSTGNFAAKFAAVKDGGGLHASRESKKELADAALHLISTFAAVYASQVFVAGMRYLLNRYIYRSGSKYQDDEGEYTAESVINGIMDDAFISGTAGMVPGGSQIYAGLKGIKDGEIVGNVLESYTAEGMNNAIENMVKLSNAYQKDKSGPVKTLLFKKSAESLAALLGVPAQTIEGNITAALSPVMKAVYGKHYGGFLLDSWKRDPVSSTSKDGYRHAWEALKAGKVEEYNRIIEGMGEWDPKITAASALSAMQKKRSAELEKDPNFSLPAESTAILGKASSKAATSSFSIEDLSKPELTVYKSESNASYKRISDEVTTGKYQRAYSSMDGDAQTDVLGYAQDYSRQTAAAKANSKYEVDNWIRWASGGSKYGVTDTEAILFRVAYNMSKGDNRKADTMALVDRWMPRLSEKGRAYLMSHEWKISTKDLDDKDLVEELNALKEAKWR